MTALMSVSWAARIISVALPISPWPCSRSITTKSKPAWPRISTTVGLPVSTQQPNTDWPWASRRFKEFSRYMIPPEEV